MKAFGIDLKSCDANICIMTLDNGLFAIPDCRVRRLSLKKNPTSEELQKFQFDIVKLAEDYQVSHIFIRERPISGKFAGSAVGFKMEAAMQLAEAIKVELLSPAEMKLVISKNPLPIDFRATGLKGFQEAAFETAYVGLTKHEYDI